MQVAVAQMAKAVDAEIADGRQFRPGDGDEFRHEAKRE